MLKGLDVFTGSSSTDRLYELLEGKVMILDSNRTTRYI